MMVRCTRLCSFVVALSVALPVAAQDAKQPSFNDVPADHFAFAAVEFLKANNVLQGYPDGTFQPQKIVTRGEAVKIIVSTLVAADQLAKVTGTQYTDVPAGVWYIPYIEFARGPLGMIDGPPSVLSFRGDAAVKKAEFLKILLQGYKNVNEDPVDALSMYSEVRLPLASDVASADDWFYPYMRFAMAASMTLPNEQGLLQPGKELTRGEVSVLLYRFLMYRQGVRKQALLSLAENEILNILRLLDEKQVAEADFASNRGYLAARGALASKHSSDEEGVIKGAVKTSEGFVALVDAYQSGVIGDLQGVLTHSGDAWHLAEKAKEFAPGLQNIADQMQQIAKNMADQARAELAKQG